MCNARFVGARAEGGLIPVLPFACDCAQVSRERGGDTVDRQLLKGVVDLFVEMGLGSLDIYRDGFEVGFLQVQNARGHHLI